MEMVAEIKSDFAIMYKKYGARLLKPNAALAIWKTLLTPYCLKFVHMAGRLQPWRTRWMTWRTVSAETTYGWLVYLNRWRGLDPVAFMESWLEQECPTIHMLCD